MINWNVRLRNRNFVIALVGATILLVQQVGELFGLHLNLSDLTEKIVNIITLVFSIMTLLGVVNDPTTHGLSDSEQALGYSKPKQD